MVGRINLAGHATRLGRPTDRACLAPAECPELGGHSHGKVTLGAVVYRRRSAYLVSSQFSARQCHRGRAGEDIHDQPLGTLAHTRSGRWLWLDDATSSATPAARP